MRNLTTRWSWGKWWRCLGQSNGDTETKSCKLVQLFVGLITVPSNQKTGHKKLNKYDDVFSKKSEQKQPNIDYMANEYSYEVLTKRTLLISGELHEASHISYSYYLNFVNALFVVLVTWLQRIFRMLYGGRMTINSFYRAWSSNRVAIKSIAFYEELIEMILIKL
jgi:hypothetical protein